MDTLDMAAFAAPFVARGAEVFSKTVGERLGGLVGDLCRSVADRFRDEPSGQQALAAAQEKPDSEIKQAALQAAIAGKMEEDAVFAEQIERLVKSIEKECRGAVFDQREQKTETQANIAGDVQGSVFSGIFEGAVAKEGNAIDLRNATIIIETLISNSHPPKYEEKCFQNPFMPDPPKDFTGRDEELAELLEKFAAGRNAILLHGNGGVGKTALALKLVESIKDRYPDGQIMVDMMGTTNPISSIEAMGSIINSFNPEEKIPDSKAKVVQRFLQVLNGKRVLLLLDNALDDKQVSGLISLPKGCALLVTSRNAISGLLRKDIGVLKPEHAVKLMLRICFTALGREKSSIDDPTWPEIARLCGFLPLALRAAASFLANSDDISPKEYAQELKDERTRLEKIGEQGVEMSVEASFGLSFRRLAPAVQKTFLDLSVFPADFDAQAEEKICQDAGHKNLSELLRWSLVDYRSLSSDYGRYRVHDLARIFASAKQPDESRATIAERHAICFRDLLAASGNLYLQGGAVGQAGLALFDREEANIMAGQRWAEENIGNDELALELCRSYPNSGAYVLILRLHPEKMISWQKSAIASCQKLGDRRGEGIHLGRLGVAYSDLGEIQEAIECFDQALKIACEIWNRREQGAELCNIGNAYDALGDIQKAKDCHEKSLMIAREIGDEGGEATELGNLGNIYLNMNDIKEAIDCHDQALKIACNIGDSMIESAELNSLGRVFLHLGKPQEAIEYIDHALKCAREIKYTLNEGLSLANLGRAYDELGQREKAIQSMREALSIFEQIGSPIAENVRSQLAAWQAEKDKYNDQ